MRIVHVMRSSAFAGTERYVAEVAIRQARMGHEVFVVGGDAERLRGELAPFATSLPGETTSTAALSAARVGRADIVHAHLTAGELAAALARARNRAPIVSTRHIAAHRGRSWGGRMAAPLLRRVLARQFAISQHVARQVDGPCQVLYPGVAVSAASQDARERTVLVLQRLEPEKMTEVALKAWTASRLGDAGWQLLIAGSGSERLRLEEQTGDDVQWLGYVGDVESLLRTATAMIAPTPNEALGLAVLEAMAAGVACVAAAAGGHLETLGPTAAGLFAPGDHVEAGEKLRKLCMDATLRQQEVQHQQRRQRASFDVDRHVQDLQKAYLDVIACNRKRTA